MDLVPKNEWIFFGPAVILHGRYTCTSSDPKCPSCVLEDVCEKRGVDGAGDGGGKGKKKGGAGARRKAAAVARDEDEEAVEAEPDEAGPYEPAPARSRGGSTRA